jgi:hypothetical protein
MTSEEIYSQFLKKEKRVLQLGSSNNNLKTLLEPEKFIGVDIIPGSDICCDLNNDSEIDNLPEGFDYVVLAGILECVTDPINLIQKVKNKAKSTIIYEYKYDDGCDVRPHWKKSWQNVGLEFAIKQEFDYINSIFLGYATLHICEMPFNQKEENVNQ